MARLGRRIVGAAGSALESQRLHLESQIDSSFAGVSGTQALLERTSHVLATVSSGVGVAVAVVAGGDTLEHVHFSRLGQGRVLAVVVTTSGLVRDRMLTLDVDVTPRELEAAANFLNEHFRGWSVERVRAEIGRLVERERREYHLMLSQVEQLWAGAVPESGAEVQTVYVEGVANLLGNQAVGSAEDVARLRELMAALETKQRLVELLDAYIDAKQESVRVIFDLEEHMPEMAGLVLIAAPARMAGEGRGTVGVIGPKGEMPLSHTTPDPIEIHQLLENSGFEVTRLETGEFRDEPHPEFGWILHLLERYRLSTELRGDGIYAVGRKTGAVRERYPAWLYA